MIKHTIGSAKIFVCESTANCIVYNPNQSQHIAEYIQQNNYVCGAIYHPLLDTALELHKLVGGDIYTDIEGADQYKKTLC